MVANCTLSDAAGTPEAEDKDNEEVSSAYAPCFDLGANGVQELNGASTSAVLSKMLNICASEGAWMSGHKL